MRKLAVYLEVTTEDGGCVTAGTATHLSRIVSLLRAISLSVPQETTLGLRGRLAIFAESEPTAMQDVTSKSPQAHTVLPCAITKPTTRQLCIPIQQTSQESAAFIDLRIGLHLLGQEGRILLARYIQVKSHQQVLCSQAQTLEKREPNNGN